MIRQFLRNKYRGALVRLVGPILDLYFERKNKFLLHPRQRLLEKAARETADYIASHLPRAIYFMHLNDLHAYCCSRISIQGLNLEFGVGPGNSINFLAGRLPEKIHGFDSFLGLPEDWSGRFEARGHYSLQGVPPRVRSNVVIHKGLFDETLPDFLKENPEPIALLHMDADLYSSTSYVLNQLRYRIKKGTVIIFDEYFNYFQWKEHEYKAFQEFVSENTVSYQYLCFGFQQVGLVITGINRPPSIPS